MNTHEKEIRTLERLVAGQDPVSGRPLARQSPYRNPEVVQAIETALTIVRGRPEQDDRPARSGKPWSKEEIDRLVARHQQGEEPAAIARHLERSKTAIVARLVQLGLMDPPAGLQLRYPMRGVSEES